MTKGADQRADQAHASSPVQRASPQRVRGRARRGAALTQASAGTQGGTNVSAEAGAQPGTRVRRRPRATTASSPRPKPKSELEPEVPVAEQARRSRIAQGLPPTIQDPATLAYIARLLLPTIGKPHRSR